MPKLKCRTAYSAREEIFPGLIFADDEGLTQQHFKAECDINTIVRNYTQTGIWEHVAVQSPVYGDVSEIPLDLISSYEAVERAEAAFMSLPSEVRKSLDNDPTKLSTWISDPANREVAIRSGLIVAPQETVVSKNDVSETALPTDSKVEE